MNNSDSIARRHETTDAQFGSVFVTGIALLGIMVFGLLLSWGVYALWIGHTSDPGTHAETLTHPDLSKRPSGPLIEADPHAHLVALRLKEDSVLTSYGWVNEDSGIVRVPVDRAIELMVKKGLPYQNEKVTKR